MEQKFRATTTTTITKTTMTTQTTNIINRDSDPANFDNLWIVRESKVVLGVELLRRQKKAVKKALRTGDF